MKVTGGLDDHDLLLFGIDLEIAEYVWMERLHALGRKDHGQCSDAHGRSGAQADKASLEGNYEIAGHSDDFNLGVDGSSGTRSHFPAHAKR